MTVKRWCERGLSTGGAAIACAMVAVLATAPAVAAPSAVTLRCGGVLDVKHRRIDHDVAIQVEDGVIRAIEPWLDVADRSATTATVIDLSSRHCLPGLMDMHTHLSMQAGESPAVQRMMTQSSATEALLGLKRAQIILQHGITTVRIVGEADKQFSSVNLRDAIDRGDFDGPRMLVAQHALSQTGGPSDANDVHAGWPEVVGAVVKAGVDNVREAVREEKKRGSTWIKVLASGSVMSSDDPRFQGFTDEELVAFAEEAHRLGMKITAHAHANRPALAVARAGFDSIEHGSFIEDDTIEMMKKNNVVLVPTRYVVEWVVATGVKGGISEASYRKAIAANERARLSLQKAYKAGVRIAMGSDSLFPVTDTTREFAAMVRAGVRPWDSIRAGTIVSAELLGLDATIGSLEAGKQADIVAVPGDPVADIAQLEHVDFVMKGGKIVRNDSAPK